MEPRPHTELVELPVSHELRIGAAALPQQGGAADMMREWADRVQSLEEQLEALRGTLETLARHDGLNEPTFNKPWAIARAALEESSPAKHPTLDDRNPASVVGVPWNEDGYAGGESTPASRQEP